MITLKKRKNIVHPIVEIKAKHPMVSQNENEPVFDLTFPYETAKQLWDRLPDLLVNKHNEDHVTLAFSGEIIIPEDVVLVDE